MSKKKPRPEIQEGFLHYDKNDGWCLDGEGPQDGCRIKDLFHDFDERQIRIAIEVVEDKK